MFTLNPNINILYHVTILKENVMSTAHAYSKKNMHLHLLIVIFAFL